MNREEEKRAVGKDFYVLLVLLLVQKQASVVAMRMKKRAFLRKKKVEKKKNCVSFFSIAVCEGSVCASPVLREASKQKPFLSAFSTIVLLFCLCSLLWV